MAFFGLTSSVGGIEMVMARLLPRLASEFQVLVLDPYGNADYGRLLDQAGVARHSLGREPRRKAVGGQGRLGRLLSLARQAPWMLETAFRLRRWTIENKPAVLYFNQAQAAAFFSKFLPAGGPKLIYHAHGSLGGADVRNARAIGRRFDHVLAVSQWVKNRLTGAGLGEEKVSVVFNGVDGQDIRRRAQRPETPLPERRPNEVVIAHVGVLTPNKGQLRTLEALAQLPANASVWFCGDIPQGGDAGYRAQLDSRTKALGLVERVRYLGWRDDVPFVLAQSDICLLPSMQESFGMALLEAMALAKPCVGADTGGIPEIIEHGRTGFVAQADAESLAEALAKLVGSRELREHLGRAGKIRADEAFSLERQAGAIAAVLRDAA